MKKLNLKEEQLDFINLILSQIQKGGEQKGLVFKEVNYFQHTNEASDIFVNTELSRLDYKENGWFCFQSDGGVYDLLERFTDNDDKQAFIKELEKVEIIETLPYSKVLEIEAFVTDLFKDDVDEAACNYDIDALIIDSSCIYPGIIDCEGNTYPYFIGQEAFGGIIFYIDETGEHGIVASIYDLSNPLPFGCYGQDLQGNTGDYIGSGLQNTEYIAEVCWEVAIAAKQSLIHDNGYSEWYLPSKNELVEVYNTLGAGSPNGNIGAFTDEIYWSSSEYYSGLGINSWYVNFSNGYTYVDLKSNYHLVRPIRSF